MRRTVSPSRLVAVVGLLVLVATGPAILVPAFIGNVSLAWAQTADSTRSADSRPKESGVEAAVEKNADQPKDALKPVPAAGPDEKGLDENAAKTGDAKKDDAKEDNAEKDSKTSDAAEADAAKNGATGGTVEDRTDSGSPGGRGVPLDDFMESPGETDFDLGAAAKNFDADEMNGDFHEDGRGAARRNGRGRTPADRDALERINGDFGNDFHEERIVERGGSEKFGSGSLKPKESFLVWLYNSLGMRYVAIFLIITFNAVALIVMIVLGMRRSVICPPELAAAFEARLNERQYQEAYELAKQSRSFLGKVLAAGMSRLTEGYDASLVAMQEVGEEHSVKMEQRNGYIALIAQISPMFGLLGTVDGMVMAFDVIAHSNVTPKPSELAQGIGTALVTTVVGLWIAIPAMVFYHAIRNRVTRLVAEAAWISGNLMKRFATVRTPDKKE
jgi:biopolymer transport protein ExbB